MDPELVELFERLAELSRPEVSELIGRLRDALRATAQADAAPDPATLEVMQTLADSIATAVTREAELADIEATATAEANRILAEAGVEIEPPAAEGDDGGGEPVAAEGGDAAGVEGAEVQAIDEAAPAGTDGGEGAGEAVEPVAAAGARPQRPSLRSVAQRLPAAARPRPRAADQSAGSVTLVAHADVPGFVAGAPIDDGRHLFEALVEKYATFADMSAPPEGKAQKLPVARMRVSYPEDRRLDMMEGESVNGDKIRAVVEPSAIAASGGLCAPVAVRYELANITDSSRPLRDSLPGFQATRGGLRFVEPPRFSDTAVQSATGVWTEANDIALNSPATKAITTVQCGTVDEVLVDAITKRMKFGNFNARYFPEQFNTYQALITGAHARRAERNLLVKIAAKSTRTVHGQYLGAIRDFLATIDLATAAARNRHRTVVDMPFRLLMPAWAFGMFRADLARQMPGDTGDARERLATADAEIRAMIAIRNVNLTVLLEGETSEHQDFATQGVGPINPWPSTIVSYLFHEGAFIFLDGGTLDLGLVRDSVLNPTNDFETFSETFENVAFVGVESLKLVSNVCPSGAAAGLEDTTNLCTVSS